jgi:chromosome segregation ATPase
MSSNDSAILTARDSLRTFVDAHPAIAPPEIRAVIQSEHPSAEAINQALDKANEALDETNEALRKRCANLEAKIEAQSNEIEVLKARIRPGQLGGDTLLNRLVSREREIAVDQETIPEKRKNLEAWAEDLGGLTEMSAEQRQTYEEYLAGLEELEAKGEEIRR